MSKYVSDYCNALTSCQSNENASKWKAVCHATFDNEYRKRHELCHSDYLKVQRHVRYKVAGALDSPFVVR